MTRGMPGHDATLAYDNATFASATAICEVRNSTLAMARDAMEATARCDTQRTYEPNKLDTTISGEGVIQKEASDGSEYDKLLTDMISPGYIDNVWLVDAFNDGVFCARMMVENLEETQNSDEVIRFTLSLRPMAQIQEVVNGSLGSGS